MGPEDDDALEEFWGRLASHPDRDRKLDDQIEMMCEQIFDLWFAFDRPLEDGDLVVDRFLHERERDLFDGEKHYLRAVRGSSMHLYEIEDLRPGESLTLRDVLEGDRIRHPDGRVALHGQALRHPRPRGGNHGRLGRGRADRRSRTAPTVESGGSQLPVANHAQSWALSPADEACRPAAPRKMHVKQR